MSALQIALLTWGFTAVIGFFIASIVWALPKLIGLLDRSGK